MVTIEDLKYEKELQELRKKYVEYRDLGDETMMKITERRAKALKIGRNK